MLNEILDASGVKHRQGRFPQPPADTYAVYFDAVEIDGADPVGFPPEAPPPVICRHNCRVELYEPRPDPASEAAVEAAIRARGLVWTKEDRYWLQDVQRYQVIYDFEYAIKA